ncbi:MAG: homocitrate synthase [Candidatus Dormiibacterota bacterium]|jgi:homocitrate synthase
MSVERMAIIDSTLREGEQFAGADFTTAEKLEIIAALDEFGVEYIEMTSPAASPQSEADLRAAVTARPRARLLTHTRCSIQDVDRALATGVDGVNVLFATSEVLRRASHGRSLDEVVEIACGVISHVRGAGREVRFSCEDAFRSDLEEILTVYRAVDACGPDRVGIADTVGVATPREVEELVVAVRAAVGCDIEFHGHNDTGCAVANALAALEAGATHIDTTVLGIGERNGIASLSGLIARIGTVAPARVDPYRLDRLPQLDARVAGILGIGVPFNAPITGAFAFTHKAGMHSNAVLRDPRSYEVLLPERYGLDRQILVGHRLVGRHAIRDRALILGLDLDETQIAAVTAQVKRLADTATLSDDQVDDLLLRWPSPVA